MRLFALAIGMLCASFIPSHAETGTEPAASLTRMPIKEVTIFKDGHAFVVHQGSAGKDHECSREPLKWEWPRRLAADHRLAETKVHHAKPEHVERDERAGKWRGLRAGGLKSRRRCALGRVKTAQDYPRDTK